jgi:hypothetical protein
MKAIIFGATTAFIAVAARAAPAGATSILSNNNICLSANLLGKTSCTTSAGTTQGSGILSGNNICLGANLLGSTSCGPAAVKAVEEAVDKEDKTITINNVCGDAAEFAKLSSAHKNVIINSNGVCEKENTAVVTVATTPPAPVQTASVAPAPVAELPQTGTNEVIASVLATILAGSTYAGTMAIRAFRARA